MIILLQYYTIIIDINDFSQAFEKFYFILYADDTSAFNEGYEYDTLIEIINNEIKIKLIFGYKQMVWLSIKRKLIKWSFIEQELKQNQAK